MNLRRYLLLLAVVSILTGCAQEGSSQPNQMNVQQTNQTSTTANHSVSDTESIIHQTTTDGTGTTDHSDTTTETFPVKHTALSTAITTTTPVVTSTTVETTMTSTTTTTGSVMKDDVTAPILLNGGWGTKILRGSSFHLDDCVGYADNYDSSPVLTYSGTVDTNVCGTYPIKATVTDASGNELTWDLSIQVVDSMPQSGGGTPERLPFETLITQYAGENVRFGIDVSRWQEDIDFEAVRAAGCSFVIMRIGYYYDDINMDEYYLTNIKAAKEAGLEVGVYLYTIANTESEVRDNARWIAEQLDGMELDFPVVFDWERFNNFQQFGMSIRDLNELFILFAEEMERYGYSAMLYSSKTYLENFWYVQKDYPVWLAHYTSQTDYAGEYMMWQMSCRGKIPGIDADVDFNILYEDRMPE